MKFATLKGAAQSLVLSPQSPNDVQLPSQQHQRSRKSPSRSPSSHAAGIMRRRDVENPSSWRWSGRGSRITYIVFRTSLLKEWVVVRHLGGHTSKIGAVIGGGLGCCAIDLWCWERDRELDWKVVDNMASDSWGHSGDEGAFWLCDCRDITFDCCFAHYTNMTLWILYIYIYIYYIQHLLEREWERERPRNPYIHYIKNIYIYIYIYILYIIYSLGPGGQGQVCIVLQWYILTLE